jgi:hypothetical protein
MRVTFFLRLEGYAIANIGAYRIKPLRQIGFKIKGAQRIAVISARHVAFLARDNSRHEIVEFVLLCLARTTMRIRSCCRELERRYRS